MKEIIDIVKVTPISDLINTERTFHSEGFEFVPQQIESDSGVAWNCNLDLTIDTPDETVCRLFATPVSCIVSLSDSSGTRYILGETNLPAKIIILKQLNKSILTIRYTSMKPVML